MAEVKKLLQQSMTSSRGSISEETPASSVKADASEGNDTLQVMREQLRYVLLFGRVFAKVHAPSQSVLTRKKKTGKLICDI